MLVAWCALQAALAIGLAMGGLLERLPLLLAEGALFVAGLRFARRDGGHGPGATRPLDLNPYSLVMVAAIAVLGVDLGLWLVTEPLADRDSLGYHLPALATWVQAGGLVPLDRVDQVARYPYTWELVAALPVLAVGQDVLVVLPSLIAWTILGLAIVAAATRLGAPHPHALAGALCVLAMQLTRATLHSTHVDLALAACFVSSIAFALAGNVAGWVTALALVAGLKTSGLLLAGVGIVAGAALGPGTRPPRRALVVVAPALAVGAFWYVRNLLETGNPLGLVRLTVAGTTLLPGSIDPAELARTTLASCFDFGDPMHRHAAAHLLAGKTGLPGLLLVLGSFGLVRAPRVRARPTAVVLAVLVACAALYVTSPFSATFGVADRLFSPAAVGENLRYALPALGLLGVLGAAGAARLVGPGVATLGTLLVFADSTSARTLLAAFVVLASAATGAIARVVPRRAAWGLLLLAGLGVLGGWSSLRHRWEDARGRAYGVAVERALAGLPTGAVVAHVLKSGSYPLYGPRYANTVRWIPAAVGDREHWLGDLRGSGASIVALGPVALRDRGRREIAWLADPTGPFERIAGDDPERGIVLYRLR